ncbi:hypothetical protein LTR10_008887 [Elasticomyces elasticus]|nr:hypothetical protein LTR10_008887 [Elasticomyces elasticus]KAK4974140.1 hypothetical protein LTR42_004779 [Elasticomyces elasticus]
MSRHYSTRSHDSDMPLPLYTATPTADYSTFVQNLPPPAYTPTSSVAGVYENVPPPSYAVAVPVERGWSLMALWHRENVLHVAYTARDEIDDAESGRSIDGREVRVSRFAGCRSKVDLIVIILLFAIFIGMIVAACIFGPGWDKSW